MEQIKNIVGNVLSKIHVPLDQRFEKMSSIWNEVANENIRKHAKIIGIKEDTLRVSVDSPAVLYQCHLLKTKLLQRIKEDATDIKKISFKIGKVL